MQNNKVSSGTTVGFISLSVIIVIEATIIVLLLKKNYNKSKEKALVLKNK